MTAAALRRVHVALLHWPCLNKAGETVSTATTNLDVHDIARVARTYDLAGYWIVQPLENQRAMVGRIVRHWLQGPGAAIHPNRPDAVRSVQVVPSLNDVAAALPEALWVVTSAQPQRRNVPMTALAEAMARQPERDVVVCFGTGWGLAPQVLAAADLVLDPIAPGDYNHLSVRSAVAIYVDRLWQAVNRSAGRSPAMS